MGNLFFCLHLLSLGYTRLFFTQPRHCLSKQVDVQQVIAALTQPIAKGCNRIFSVSVNVLLR